jgi:hypothetical protein
MAISRFVARLTTAGVRDEFREPGRLGSVAMSMVAAPRDDDVHPARTTVYDTQMRILEGESNAYDGGRNDDC